MRVAFVSTADQPYDGWGRYTLGILRAARDAGIEPVWISAKAGSDSCLDGVERHPLLPTWPQPWWTPRSLFSRPRLFTVLQTCDLVHGLVEPCMPLIALSRPTGMPFVQTAHGTWAVRPFRRGLQRSIYHWALKKVDLVVFQSRFTRAQMASVARVRRCLVLPAGIDSVSFEADSPISLPDWAVRGPIVLSVGSLKERKGHHVAVEAVAEARRSIPGLQLVIVGDGGSSAYSTRLRKAALRLGDDVHILGRVSEAELIAWYQRADLFLLLPIPRDDSFEGLGLVYLEANAAGKACIATSDCGADEIVVDGVTGRLVPPNDVTSAAAALVGLLGDARLRDRLGSAARHRAKEHTWDHLMEHLRPEYLSLIEARGDRRRA